jgi:hypothetical protein
MPETGQQIALDINHAVEHVGRQLRHPDRPLDELPMVWIETAQFVEAQHRLLTRRHTAHQDNMFLESVEVWEVSHAEAS